MWTLDQGAGVARLDLPLWTGIVNLNRPWLGFQNSPGSTAAVAFNYLLAIDLGFTSGRQVDVPPSERFVRGTDLVASYPATSRGQYPQVYWRALRPDGASREVGLEVIASVHTNLLDSDPQISVASELVGAELWFPSDGPDQRFQKLTLDEPAAQAADLPAPYLLARWPAAAQSLVMMTYPGDGVRTQIVPGEHDSMVRIEHGLFREWLEKGVIRRSRLRTVFVDRSDDQRLAQQAYERFGRSELPLTA